jgi:hypothetical protein
MMRDVAYSIEWEQPKRKKKEQQSQEQDENPYQVNFDVPFEHSWAGPLCEVRELEEGCWALVEDGTGYVWMCNPTEFETEDSVSYGEVSVEIRSGRAHKFRIGDGSFTGQSVNI